MDALLGASGLPDIGVHFPPGDAHWHNANSLQLLTKVVDMIGVCGWQVGNVDLILIAEEPKIGEYREIMKENLALVLHLDVSRVGIKATTNEGLDALGRGEGMAAMATVMLHREQV
jgi:2-C-methyl-D-erythritol 2,4-cyclodiphosphate synthase